MIIYEKTPGALVATGSRTVSTFPSGLVRVDQTYTCATAYADTHRATLGLGENMPDGNDAPAVDGLYIGQAPAETQTPEGFTEFQVSAFGRTIKTTPDLINLPERLSFAPINFSVWRASGSVVIPYNTVLSPRELGLTYDDVFLTPFDISRQDISRAYPLSIVETTITKPTATIHPLPDVVREEGAFNQLEYRLPIEGVREYTVQMTTDGTTQLGADIVFSLRDPEIRYSAFRTFGKFMEIDFETVRTPYLLPE